MAPLSGPDTVDHEQAFDDRLALDRMMTLIPGLAPFDREVILLYLEGLDGASARKQTAVRRDTAPIGQIVN